MSLATAQGTLVLTIARMRGTTVIVVFQTKVIVA